MLTTEKPEIWKQVAVKADASVWEIRKAKIVGLI
jgi:hypothetical protein